MADLKDEEIAKLIQQGDGQSFAVIVERYEPRLLRYAKKFLFDHEDSKDRVQDVFLKAYVNINSFNTSRVFSSWIYRIAHNEFINAIKKKGAEPISFFDPDTLFPHPVAPTTAEDDLQKNETKKMLEQGLSKLDVKYREVLVLYYFEEFEYKEISEILHIPVSTAAIRLKRGREALKKVLTP